VISAIASGTDRAQLQRQFDKVNAAGGDVQQRENDGLTGITPRLEEALRIRNLLMQTGDELTNLLRGLNGSIPQHLVVICCRMVLVSCLVEIHVLDPIGCRRQVHTKGETIAQQILAQHLKEHGQYPETVAVMLWDWMQLKLAANHSAFSWNRGRTCEGGNWANCPLRVKILGRGWSSPH